MQSLRKIKRVQPLIRLKKQKFDEEALTLTQIRNEKIKIVASMKDSQRRYMEGVEKLNNIRGSGARDNLETLEQALDFVKSEWQRLFLKVQEAERREKSQIMRLMTAERDLKAIERLQGKYQTEFTKEQDRAEQKTLDEIALRKFNVRT